MKNVILNICEKLKGAPYHEEYFEVIRVERQTDSEYAIIVKIVNNKAEGDGEL